MDLAVVTGLPSEWLALGLLAIIFAGFISEKYPPEVIALAGAASAIGFGLLDLNEAYSVFSSSAPITIAAMFILTGALVRTGTLDAVAGWAMARGASHPMLTIVAILLATMVFSAFVNNTPLVIILIPIVIRFAGSIGESPSRYLMPLSFAGILGGTCSLIGTSTNLLVDGVAQSQGLKPFGIFEIAPIGILVALTGTFYMIFIGRKLLPNKGGADQVLKGEAAAEYTTELKVAADSRYVGRVVSDINALSPKTIRVRALNRAMWRAGSGADDKPLQAGDVLRVTAPLAEILTLYHGSDFILGAPHFLPNNADDGEEEQVLEALVSPERSVAGRTIDQLSFPSRYGAALLAVHRHRIQPDLGRFGDIRLQAGDMVVLSGPEAGISALARGSGLVRLSEPKERPYRRAHAPIAVAALALTVILAAMGVMPLGGLAILAVALILLTRCIDSDEAFAAIDSRILILIFSMLAIGKALESSGTVALIAGFLSSSLQGAHPIALLACLYLVTSFLTETVTNNAVAVVITPVAVGLAASLGYDPRPFVVTVMFGASASFATPIGYQTNTLVYGAANYRFIDFVKVGLPLNIIAGAATIAGIWFYYGLTPVG